MDEFLFIAYGLFLFGINLAVINFLAKRFLDDG